MKRFLIFLFVTILFLGLGWLVPHSDLEVTIETSTPPASPSSNGSLPEPIGASPTGLTPMPTPMEELDPYGELYFSIVTPKEYASPATPPPGLDESTTRLARLPGSCVVGLVACPAPEIVSTPFNMKDVLAIDSDSGALTWSPDGRYGLIVIHSQDDITRGWTSEEWEKLKNIDLSDLNISSSSLYLLDAENDTWSEIYHADRKFFYSVNWSSDGQWIAFTIASSLLNIHPSQADDGIYIVRPDGTDLKRMGNTGYILGWSGNSIILFRYLHPGSTADFSHVVERLSFDGQVTRLFESSRLVHYSLAPDGGSLLAADSTTRIGGSPQKAVDVLALDGSVIRSFGTFANYSSAIYPFTWSLDGSQVAFANTRRLYVAPRVSQLDFPADTFGVHPDTREVYLADDTNIAPDYVDIQFSNDNKFLLAEVFEGFTHFVVVSLESGKNNPLVIPHMDPFVQDDNFLGVLSFFSWRQ